MSLEVETGWVPKMCPFCFSLLINSDHLHLLALNNNIDINVIVSVIILNIY